MRQEDKEVDGFELEREEERKRESELVEDDAETLYDLDGKPEYEREQERSGLVAGAMHKILEREHIVINDLELSRRELRALEALKTAVDGRDQSVNAFVYAEDRRALLEQALAVLQPDLANLQQVGGAPFEELLHEVAHLREQLEVLEDAQEELEPHKRDAAKAEDADDKDDDDKPDDDTSLTGPERKIDKPASSLAGPERKVEPKPPTSLGDPNEIAEAAATPWWKRG